MKVKIEKVEKHHLSLISKYKYLIAAFVVIITVISAKIIMDNIIKNTVGNTLDGLDYKYTDIKKENDHIVIVGEDNEIWIYDILSESGISFSKQHVVKTGDVKHKSLENLKAANKDKHLDIKNKIAMIEKRAIKDFGERNANAISSNESFEETRNRIMQDLEKRKKEIQPISSFNKQLVVERTKPEENVSVNRPANHVKKQGHQSEESKSELLEAKHGELDSNAESAKNNSKGSNVAISSGHKVFYNGTEFIKVGYNNDGSKKPLEVEYAERKNIASKIIEQNDDFSVLYKTKSKEKKGNLVIFTDPTCPYCKNLHGRMDEILDLGYDVNYVFYPRYLAYGSGNENAKANVDMVKSIWCAPDQKLEMDSIYAQKNGYSMSGYDCSNNPEKNITFPAYSHYMIGEIVNLKSTPAIILPSGKMVSGIDELMSNIQ